MELKTIIVMLIAFGAVMTSIEYWRTFLAIGFATLAIWFGNELRITAALKKGHTRSIERIKKQEVEADKMCSKYSPNTERYESRSYNAEGIEIKKFENDPL